MERGPSDEWFRKFFARHPELSEKKPEKQDRSRTRMANQNVIDNFFKFFGDLVDENVLADKPGQVSIYTKLIL